METVILVLLVLLVVGLGWNIVTSSRDKPAKAARKRKPAEAAPPRRPRRKPAIAAADPSLEIPEMNFFKPSPEDGEFYIEKQSSRSSMTELMEQAEMISQSLASRQAILDGFSNPDYDPKKISELVLSDPGLAAEVLKTVNSPFYGLSQKIASVFRAIVLLGHVEVRNIIWRSCVGQTKGSDDVRVNLFLDSLWHHSFAVSRVAYAIARERNLSEPDTISTTALLHDIGKLICVNTWPDKALGLYDPVSFSSARVLAGEAELGFHHAALGAEIAQSWGLPGETCATVRQSHAPSYLEPEEVQGDRGHIAVVHIADLICHNALLQAGGQANAVLYLPRDGWLRTLGIDSLGQIYTARVMKALPRVTASEGAAALRETQAPQPV